MRDARSIPVILRQTVSLFSVLLMLLFPGGAILFAQDFGQNAPPPAPQGPPPQQAQLLSPDQLNNLVAPVALYPDNLLSQVLVASTYPLEIVEASQWLQQNRNLQGQQLVDAARQMNWDPSIQALVVFPDVLNRLASDAQWTTALGNAFLAQQADVMNAVQNLRAEARASGKLNSGPQQTVTTQTQDGQSAIDIMPANPQEIYVPQYNPDYVWGPPPYGYYPPLYYPPVDYGFGFYPGIYLGGFFGGLGWGLGWGGWGWGCNWFGGGILTNAFFFNHYGYHGGWGHGGWGGHEFAGSGGFHGGAWAHNAEHRGGVPYNNQGVANRFGGTYARGGSYSRAGQTGGFARSGAASGFARNGQAGGFNRSGAATGRFGSSGAAGARSLAQGSGAQSGGWRSFGQSGAGTATGRQGFNSASHGGAMQPGFRSSPSYGGNRGFGGSNGFRSAPSYSAPAYRGGSGGFSGAPAYRSSPSFGGGGFRAAPSQGGGFSAHSSGGGSFHSSGGGGFNGGGGGGFHGGGGGGFHGGGGSSHGGGGGHGGGHR